MIAKEGVQAQRPRPSRANLVLFGISLLVAVGIAETGMRRLYAGRPFTPGRVGEFKNRPSKNFVTDDLTYHEFVCITEGCLA
jgi:hypothetical protein